MTDQLFPKLPLKEWIETFVKFLTDNLGVIFDGISSGIKSVTDGLVWLLSIGHIPGSAYILIVIISLIAWRVAGWKTGLFSLIGLALIDNLGYWSETLDTLSLIIISVIFSMIIGIPIGIWMSQKASVQSTITPILDFMQTMPAFVYLIPSVVFFGIGMVPGVIATIIFSMPPTVRMTNLGIRQVDGELIEAANAFGSTTAQRLGKVQIPLAMPTMMAGVNQTIMLSLSMVVTASLVGAPGLGEIVYRSVTQIKIGLGFEGGLALVIIAMVLDRITQGVNKK
ncbi:glycine betaine transport system permease protein OpuAB [Bacillus sp. J14TS2]|uniref:ABC transporter permease n=1 Tax=Bacillus sp. J14TS2 TaxID=2807188 RepID=UPI001B0515AA|nr:proline/glycine betaine ABC transporter permease [Bacillus sp. J14TS2]GIN73242.1 glycine betaine transport system permease protein OpuAB [Bacillus sp. J14TS2]